MKVYKKSHLLSRIIRGSAVIFTFTLLAAPLGYLLRILYSRTLSIEDYGLFYAVFSLFLIFGSYNDFGFGSSLSYYIPKFVKKSNFQLVWNSYKYSQIISFIVSIILSFVFVILADWLSAHYFKNPQARQLIYIFVIFLIASGFISITGNFFMGLQKEKYYASKELIRLFFSLVFSLVFLIFYKPSLVIYAWAWSLAHLVTAGIFYYLLYKKTGHIITIVRWNKDLFSKLLNYAIPSLITVSIYTLITSTDIIFLTLFRGVREVGIYNIVLPIVSIPLVIMTPLCNFLFPLTSHLMEENERKVRDLVDYILIYVPFMVFYFVFFLILFPSATIGVLFGDKWVELAKYPLIIISIGSLFTNVSNYLMTVVLGMGFIKERMRISVILAVVNVIISSTLIYFWGIVGAAIAYICIYVISTILYARLIRSKISFRYPITFYAKLLGLGILLYLVVTKIDIYPTSLASFIGIGGLYTIVMLVSGYLLKLFDKKMIKLLFTRS